MIDEKNETVKHLDIIIPKYQLSTKEEESELSPVLKTIFKTMEVTESFTLYSVLEYLAKMDKSIADKQAEIDGLVNMKEAYLKEMKVIEDQLGLKNLEQEYIKTAAEKVAAGVIEEEKLPE